MTTGRPSACEFHRCGWIVVQFPISRPVAKQTPPQRFDLGQFSVLIEISREKNKLCGQRQLVGFAQRDIGGSFALFWHHIRVCLLALETPLCPWLSCALG
jgi:hypothetical protein